MNAITIVGLGMMAVGVVLIAVVAIGKGKTYDYLWGVFVCELGGLFIASSLLQGSTGIAVIIFLNLLLLMTTYVHRKAVRRDTEAQTGLDQ